MLTGASKVTVEAADLRLSATLVAVTVTDCSEAMLAGAVYRPPLVMVPRLGFRDQVTAVLPEPPVTVGVNCWVWPPEREALAGDSEMPTEASKLKLSTFVPLP